MLYPGTVQAAWRAPSRRDIGISAPCGCGSARTVHTGPHRDEFGGKEEITVHSVHSSCHPALRLCLHGTRLHHKAARALRDFSLTVPSPDHPHSPPLIGDIGPLYERRRGEGLPYPAVHRELQVGWGLAAAWMPAAYRTPGPCAALSACKMHPHSPAPDRRSGDKAAQTRGRRDPPTPGLLTQARHTRNSAAAKTWITGCAANLCQHNVHVHCFDVYLHRTECTAAVFVHSSIGPVYTQY